jgi:hypothetical protein
VTAPLLPDRDRADVEALIADRYLDALLAAGDRHAADAPTDPLLDPELRDAVRVLRRSLVRVHPSFRFEERLAGRLAELAATQGGPLAAGEAEATPGSAIIPFPAASAGLEAADPLLAAILAGELDPADEAALDLESRLAAARRPLLVGGAITSAAISLVGVAWVAWRASRPASRPADGALGRAARAARARGAAVEGLAGGGLGGPG